MATVMWWIGSHQHGLLLGVVAAWPGEMSVFFFAGSLLALAHDRLPRLFRADLASALLVVHLLMLAVVGSSWTRFSFLTLPYAILTAGLASTPYLRRAGRFGDFSFGLYLWGLPIQQVVVGWLEVRSLHLNLVIVVAASFLLAFMSWHLVQSPALRVKTRIIAGLPPSGQGPDQGRHRRTTRVPDPTLGFDLDGVLKHGASATTWSRRPANATPSARAVTPPRSEEPGSAEEPARESSRERQEESTNAPSLALPSGHG